MTDPTQDDDGDAPQQRTVSTTDCSPVHTAAASSVFARALQGWGRPAGNGEGETPQEPTPQDHPPQPNPEEEKPTMAKKRAARGRKSSNGSPQQQICSALLQNDLTREQLAEACSDLTAAQISSALNNAKSHGRIAWIEKDGVYRLTKTGQEWVNAAGAEALSADAPKNERPARKTAHRRARAKRKEADTSPTQKEDTVDPTFRCAVMSDGCFFITKDGTTIELEPDEHKQMLHYLERMAEADAA